MIGPIKFTRAYYHCRACHAGIAPKDEELGIAGASITPGLSAMIDRTAVSAPFAKAADLLRELAGITLSTKRVERAAEADGLALHDKIAAESDAITDGAVIPPPPPKPRAGPENTPTAKRAPAR